ncbi:DUF2842 domain-containing protein [Siccirubricoccus sp. KC 17139]|uniref:DUF2842 domain-containing protein n=1 Tax=Siccirubricoccus soli TaxID=2899147 RepID=A0ABT1DDL1_9PROT|nr:DUF2842 domain-containing protein [Siccirubricoccus soli]MCO6420028.1 DUF2842 domain-containing protein [Siccirubricoccus soli]MCP2686165.1 DUF2842 domain-containing protein [Siccirubricoccus soli]
MPRILLASLVGLLGFFLYVVLVLQAADWVLQQHWALQVPFFLLAGTLWAWPARWLMFWGAGQR